MLFKRFTVLFGTTLLVLLSGLCVEARDSWVSVRSKHLLVIGNGSEKEIKQVATRLERFRDIVTQVFAASTADSPIPTTVIVFRDDASYRPFKANVNNAGYFQPGQDVNYITLSTESRGDQDPFSIIFHEYTHLLVNNSFGKTPAWFNEGLAEFYSTLTMSDDRLIVGRPIRRHISLLRQNLLPLRSLFQVDYKSPYYNEGYKQSIFYAESWALMHYLMSNKNGSRAMQTLNFPQNGSPNTSLDESVQKLFGTSIETLETELRSYIQQDRFRSAEMSLAGKVETQSSLVSSVISEAELLAYLGDLLLHSNRGEPDTYLQKALTLAPDLIQAHVSLGMLRYRQGRMGDAIVSLERAVNGKSPNALAYYYYAAALSRPTEGDAKLTLGYAPEVATKARAALHKAIALRPDFPDSYNLLAYVNMVTSTDIDATITLLSVALSRQPDRIDFRYMLGQLYMHKDDFKLARPLLEQVAASDLEEGVKTHTKKLLAVITDIEQAELKKAAARRTRGLRPVDTQPSEGAASTKALADPSSDLREVLRVPASGETQAQGVLQSIECDQTGVIFVVKTKDRLLRLRADTFQQVRRITFTADVRGTITCGVRQPGNPVVVCYLPRIDSRVKTDGVLSSVEFVPGDFSLIPPLRN